LPAAVDAGGYVNLMPELDERVLMDTYGQAKYERLAGIKAAYDPGNVFSVNANIKPAVARLPEQLDAGTGSSQPVSAADTQARPRRRFVRNVNGRRPAPPTGVAAPGAEVRTCRRGYVRQWTLRWSTRDVTRTVVRRMVTGSSTRDRTRIRRRRRRAAGCACHR
jgi:Berberine and berberine like